MSVRNMSDEIAKKVMDKYPIIELDVSSYKALIDSMKKEIEQAKKRHEYYLELANE